MVINETTSIKIIIITSMTIKTNICTEAQVGQKTSSVINTMINTTSNTQATTHTNTDISTLVISKTRISTIANISVYQDIAFGYSNRGAFTSSIQMQAARTEEPRAREVI